MMTEQTVCNFYTVHPQQQIVESELKQEEYSAEKVAEILNEASEYLIEFETVSKSWYEDDEQQSCNTKPIEPEQIIVKNGKFYGCLLTRERSEWSYYDMCDTKHLTSVTLDSPKANVYTMDHSTQNGDSYNITNAILIKSNSKSV